MTLKKIYNDFLDENFINDYNSLKNVLISFPYYCIFNDISNTSYVRINITTNSIRGGNEEEIIDYFDNFVIDKNDINNFFFFKKSDYLIKINNLKIPYNHQIYCSYHLLKFYLFFDGMNWIISSPNYKNISSIYEKSHFETFTLYDLLFRYFNVFNIKLNNLNKSYNYVFGLTCCESNILINNNKNTELFLLSISSKKNNKNIDITKNEINKISKRLSYLNRFSFYDKKEIFNFLNSNNFYSELFIYIKGLTYKLEFTKFTKKHKILLKLIKNPYKLYIDYYYMYKSIEELKVLFPRLTNFIDLYNLKLNNVLNYYKKLYKDEKILKKDNLVYLKYDKEIIYKIHVIHQNHRRNITKSDIISVLRNLQTNKINEIFNR